MIIEYIPEQICCKKMVISVNTETDTLDDVVFTGGCPGNHEAVRRLVRGKTVQEIKESLEGITCGGRLTSCADQLVKALEPFINATYDD